MSETPTPSEQGSTLNENQDGDWRLSVSQSYRNSEVREIAKVLAALEPGATSASKMMLAMRFEDSIFKAAGSLADYRKKMTKRLKRVQKSYVPTNTVSATNKQELIKELRNKYGESLRYISKYADKAFAELKAKYGAEKANQLQQHTTIAMNWAEDLGILPNNPTPNFNMTDEQVQKLQQVLEKRLENIRSHVVKLAHPDRFISETLQKAEQDLAPRTSKLLAMNTHKRFEQLQGAKGAFDPAAALKESLEKTHAHVPPPTRSQPNDEEAALLHLNKIKAAGTALLAFMCLPDRTTAPRNVLAKCHNVAHVGIEFVSEVMKNRRKEIKEPELSLEDAWNKAMENPDNTSVAPNPTSLDQRSVSPNTTDASGTKLTQRPAKHPVIRSRVLLTAGRKTPSNILAALKRKRATLVRPPPNGEGSHLVLEFGKAFVMTVYLVPLLVTIRAYSKNHQETIEARASGLSCANYTPLDEGLREMEELRVWGIKGNYESIGHVVEARLEDASAQATAILRRLFAYADKEKAPEFELEILEATALLEFLHNARKTFIPDWQDDDL